MTNEIDNALEEEVWDEFNNWITANPSSQFERRHPEDCFKAGYLVCHKKSAFVLGTAVTRFKEEVKKLQSENAKLKRMIDLGIGWEDLNYSIDGKTICDDLPDPEISYAKLKEQVEMMRECAKFYADTKIWERINISSGPFHFQTDWASNLKLPDCAYFNTGGGRARKALAKLAEMEKADEKKKGGG
jgi:hypothetical protein